MHDSQDTMAMRYAFITNRALRALSAARLGRVVNGTGQSLELAANLMLEMRRGVAFVRGSQANIGYSAESLPAATRALSVIERLSIASQISEIQDLLEGFEFQLRALDQGEPLQDAEGSVLLESFLRALNQSLTEEASQETLGSALETFEHVGA